MKSQESHQSALVDFLFQLADDELMVGHRNSEWLGVAPDIEEDVAFSSIAQDEIGHATFYYNLLEELHVAPSDALAFERDTRSRRNARLVEAENGDWAATITRHYFYDLFEQVRLSAILHSSYEPLALGASKIIREERYHRLHMETWFKRLAYGGEESRGKLLTAVDAIWGSLDDLFSLGEYAVTLVEAGIISKNAEQLRDEWISLLKPTFDEIGFCLPHIPMMSDGGRVGEHTLPLTNLLDTMSEVYRLQPGAKW
ncbi:MULTISPECIES: 1,2-phenylacetyl-CoA epoxidase subunit PaaC [Alicyclobacillus]|uniref:Phenylacetate-CoA oxygenase subunit PaaC n=1 Tax=Alicyclobacillus acidoterrestris (strain ATCC 49025 / DSM 3922 / CIP 106132 / NCIMB 13137 / GD3B) TaxID=1356854 RepID=T0CJY6_ALIAG|nr:MULTISPECIES: 1,2-phenylacetyl-CoA epoxidase subunit PaaC [Alicyclobacillus]EPZ52830.1 hypothetical protein N007_19545 [Alicyclobacillus acidoterrestris ATCC 49025]UNO48725.1 phenylacetate-CoA oxygenase subunit PaaC [Alicyclobacillus acidoterrestris]